MNKQMTDVKKANRKKPVPVEKLTVGSIRAFGIPSSTLYPNIALENVPDAYTHSFLMLKHLPNKVRVPRGVFQNLEEAASEMSKIGKGAGIKKATANRIARFQAWISSLLAHETDFSRQEVEESLEKVLSLKTKSGKKLFAPKLAAVLHENASDVILPVEMYVNAMQYAESADIGREQTHWAKNITHWADEEASKQIIEKLKSMIENDVVLSNKVSKMPFPQKLIKAELSFAEAMELRKLVLSKVKGAVDGDEKDDGGAKTKGCKSLTFKCNQGRDGRVYIVVQDKKVYVEKKN